MTKVHSLTWVLYVCIALFLCHSVPLSCNRQPSDGSGTVKLTNENLPTLPDNLLHDFEREGINKTFIQKLMLWGTSTEYILDRAFSSFENLTEIEILCDRSIQISECAFASSKLETIALLKCGLTTLATNCILKKLKKLKLGFNQMVRIANHTFENYVSLQELYLIGNKIMYAAPNAFLGTKLEVLSLIYNKLECVPDLGAISSTLSVLDIGNNRLHKCDIEIQSNSFPVLHSLLISNNLLTKLPIICYLSPNLLSLFINDNNFETVPDISDVAVHLNRVDLSNNPIVCDCRVSWLKDLVDETENGTVQCDKSGPNPSQDWTRLDKFNLEKFCPKIKFQSAYKSYLFGEQTTMTSSLFQTKQDTGKYL